MAKDISIANAINILAERTYENSQDISQKNKQRRTKVVDLYGIEYMRQGGGSNQKATFYISVSPDLVYYQRFQFKLIIQPFETSVASNGVEEASTGISVNNRSLSISNNSITPNPHNHGITDPKHSHNMIQGLTFSNVTADDFRITLEGEDITSYLTLQGGGVFVDGEGIFPSTNINENFDILEVASDMSLEDGDDTTRVDKLLHPGYKKVQIWNTEGQLFNVTLVNYLKYSHINR